METPPLSASPSSLSATETSRRRGPLSAAASVASWIAMVVLAVVVLGLLAITVGPKVLPYQALVVRSGSMEPTIPTGSVVFYRKEKAADVKVGDIIVFSRPDKPSDRVTHRVYRVADSSTGRYFVTKGDANGAPDAWRVPAVGTGWVHAIDVPVVGYVLYGLQSTLGRLLLLLIPAVLLGAITIGEIWRDRRNPDSA